MQQNRRNWLRKISAAMAGMWLVKANAAGTIQSSTHTDLLIQEKPAMQLGAFSVSLNVKDIQVSKQFYENLGFSVLGGTLEQKYLVMKNGRALIGLFQGMFEKTILTFNPGWDEDAKVLEKFDDVRSIQRELIAKGVKLTLQADATTKGPASIMLEDPDGNQLLIDQHV